MPLAGYEPVIPVFEELRKAVHAVDSTATAIGRHNYTSGLQPGVRETAYVNQNETQEPLEP
jgi:hypothetical protein